MRLDVEYLFQRRYGKEFTVMKEQNLLDQILEPYFAPTYESFTFETNCLLQSSDADARGSDEYEDEEDDSEF